MLERRPWLSSAVVVLLILIWGTTWGAIRVSLIGIPPLAGVALRFAIAGALLLPLGWRLGLRFRGGGHRHRLWLINSVTTFAGAYGITYWAEQFIPSSLCSILFATFPLFVALLAHVALPEERLSWRGRGGVLLGFLGVVVIFSEDLTLLGGEQMRLAAPVMLAAPLVAALGQVAIKRWGAGIHPIDLTAPPMLLAAAMMGVLSALFEGQASFSFGLAPTLALFYLAVIGSALTFTLYFWLLARHSATGVSLIAYGIPLVAVLVGVLTLDETLTLRTLLGAGLVVGGVALTS